ncbi:hypothetical protein JX266_014266, partial [Neoarthrinium moseri]
AMNLSANPPKLHTEWEKLYVSIYGVMFFGVPHKGLLTSDILKILQHQQHARSHPRRKLLNQIEQGSKALIKQLDAFADVVQHRKIVSFHELLETQSLEILLPEDGEETVELLWQSLRILLFCDFPMPKR